MPGLVRLAKENKLTCLEVKPFEIKYISIAILMSTWYMTRTTD